MLMGRHKARTDLGREFGATDVLAERGEEGVARVRELAGDNGMSKVIEAVGTRQTLETTLPAGGGDGGTISRLGVPQYQEGPVGPSMIMRNVTLTGGASPARASSEELLLEVLNGAIELGHVFDQRFWKAIEPAGWGAPRDTHPHPCDDCKQRAPPPSGKPSRLGTSTRSTTSPSPSRRPTAPGSPASAAGVRGPGLSRRSGRHPR
ncbi:hypothetical protein GCM10010206_60960 [Streptomyces cinerochromogenes]|nr:hypothetical protein GCM10010206_60960 [Streptomyces cinerochromogenes]